MAVKAYKQPSIKRLALPLAAAATAFFALFITACDAAPVFAATETAAVTALCTASPAAEPTAEPTAELTAEPTAELTAEPTAEPTVEPTPEPAADDMVAAAEYVGGAVVDLRYATADNFTGSKIYDFSEAYLRCGTALKLAEAGRRLAGYGLSLVIWDAYRPFAAQEALWAACPDASYVADPNAGFSSHSRGCTVDVSLVAADGSPVEMPSGFDEFSALADRDYSDVSDAARANVELLESVMEECGFTGYAKEWWHFSDTDTYAPLVSMEGSDIWLVECDEYLSLRSEPVAGSRVRARIPDGAEVEVIRFDGFFAKVLYGERVGWVLTKCLARPGVPEYETELRTVEAAEEYSFAMLAADLAALDAEFEQLTVYTIGLSAEGRPLYSAVVGDLGAEKHVLVQAAMHGREYMTALLVTAQLEYMLRYTPEAYEGVCFHIIPMINPDGVAIAQSDDMSALNETVAAAFSFDRRRHYTADGPRNYLKTWKANANGVDLNRNFPDGWAELRSRAQASANSYRGAAALDQPESAALAAYTGAWPFAATVSYHSSGSMIYCFYGDREDANAASYSLALAIEAESGYAPVADTSYLASGGYKDWALNTLGIPSVTVEIGTVESPLPLDQFDTVYRRNIGVLSAVAEWVRGR